MIITKTPFRISFFGGGSDFPEFFNKNSGSIISTTIDKYCYVMVRNLPNFFNYTNEISYSKIEKTASINEIEHPSIKEAMKMLNVNNIRLTYEADLPARSGLGTSSAFAVGMLNAFHTLKGVKVDKKQLANEAIRLERELCKEAGGWQDQIATSLGGLNRIDFNNDTYNVKPINMPHQRKQQLNSCLLLFFTGFTRLSSEIHKDNNIEVSKKHAVLKEMLKLVNEAEEILINPNRDLDDFGRLLHKTWEMKKQTGNNVSSKKVDDLYERGIKAGAIGGKLLGAGGGAGFLLFYVNPHNKEKIINELKELLYVPFNFENEGTQIIYNNQERKAYE